MTPVSRALPLFLLCATSSTFFCSESSDGNQLSSVNKPTIDVQSQNNGVLSHSPNSGSPQLPRRKSSSAKPVAATGVQNNESETSDTDDIRVVAKRLPLAVSVAPIARKESTWYEWGKDAVESWTRQERTVVLRAIRDGTFLDKFKTVESRSYKITNALREIIVEEGKRGGDDMLMRADEIIEFADGPGKIEIFPCQKSDLREQAKAKIARLKKFIKRLDGTQDLAVSKRLHRETHAITAAGMAATSDFHRQHKQATSGVTAGQSSRQRGSAPTTSRDEETKTGSHRDISVAADLSVHRSIPFPVNQQQRENQLGSRQYSKDDDRLYSSEEDQS